MRPMPARIQWGQFSDFLAYERGIKITPFYKAALRHIKDYFTGKVWSDQEFRGYLAHLSKEHHLKNVTVNQHLTIGRHIDSFFKTHELSDFRRLKEEEPPDRYLLTDLEMRQIADCYLKRGRDERKDNTRYHAAIQTLRFTGMRPDELCNLLWVNDHGTYFELTHTKTSKKRFVPIPVPLRTALNKLERYPHNFIFGSQWGPLQPKTLNNEIQRRVKKLGMNCRVSSYNFRASMITWCALGGGEGTLPRLAKICGHSLETSFKYYQKYTVSDLTDALISSHPGLKKGGDIDTVKRVLMDMIKRLVDMGRFDVSLEILPKTANVRKLYIS